MGIDVYSYVPFYLARQCRIGALLLIAQPFYINEINIPHIALAQRLVT